MDVIENLLDGDSDDSDDDSLLMHFATTHLRARVRKSWKEFSDVEFREFFRFDKSDFPRLRSALLVPETLCTKNAGVSFSSLADVPVLANTLEFLHNVFSKKRKRK